MMIYDFASQSNTHVHKKLVKIKTWHVLLVGSCLVLSAMAVIFFNKNLNNQVSDYYFWGSKMSIEVLPKSVKRNTSLAIQEQHNQYDFHCMLRGGTCVTTYSVAKRP